MRRLQRAALQGRRTGRPLASHRMHNRVRERRLIGRVSIFLPCFEYQENVFLIERERAFPQSHFLLCGPNRSSSTEMQTTPPSYPLVTGERRFAKGGKRVQTTVRMYLTRER